MANVELMMVVVVVVELLWSAAVAVEFWGVDIFVVELLELQELRKPLDPHCHLLNLELAVQVVM